MLVCLPCLIGNNYTCYFLEGELIHFISFGFLFLVKDCKPTEVSCANQLIKILADTEFLSSQIGLVVGHHQRIRATEMLHMCHHRENVQLQNCSWASLNTCRIVEDICCLVPCAKPADTHCLEASWFVFQLEDRYQEHHWRIAFFWQVPCICCIVSSGLLSA
jgi:hypothetical protein